MIRLYEITQVERHTMLRKTLLFLILSMLVILSGACTSKVATEAPPADTEEIENSEISQETEPEIEFTATHTPEPTNTPEPTPAQRTIIWEDDFSDVTSGWERYREFDGVLDYLEEEEVYQMRVLAENSIWWVWMEEEWFDIGMSVDAWQVDGLEGSLYGLMCRYDPNTNDGYVFLINTEGQAGVGIIGDNFDFEALPGGELTDFDVIQTGLNVKNTLEAVCMGEALKMSVNGELLFDLPAVGFAGDDIGFSVVTIVGGGIDAYFDNLIVFEP